MAFRQHLFVILNSLVLITFVGAEDDVGGKNATNNVHVAIGPVENITTYLIGTTNIVVAWDPPSVYLIHDVLDATFDELTPETEVVVSKHENSGAVEPELLANGTIDAPNSTNAPTDLASSVSPPPPSSTWQWKCKPISFFDNYTVALKENMTLDDDSMVVAFKDSIEAHEQQVIKWKENQKSVPFSEGCITGYEIYWEEASAVSQDEKQPDASGFNMLVSSTSRTANITGLKPEQLYKITVAAVYVSGDTFTNKPPVYFKTKAENESKACSCDWYGTQSPSMSCSMKGPTYCRCKIGYEGTFCEMCALGYYRVAPAFPCHRCPCDSHATRASTCHFVEGFLHCESCEVGYTGNLCHTCDHGFYRLNYKCVPCHCNGNSSPHERSMCHPTTGLCISCAYNTTGFNCEHCRPGYIGDPIRFKNCTLAEEVRARSLNRDSSTVGPGVVAAIVVFIVLVIMAITVLIYRWCRSSKKQKAFWTVEMKRESDDVDINSVHNDDDRLNDMDDLNFFSKCGISSSTGKYSRLQEEI